MIQAICYLLLRIKDYDERLTRAGRPLYAGLDHLPTLEEERVLMRVARKTERALRQAEAAEWAEAFNASFL